MMTPALESEVLMASSVSSTEVNCNSMIRATAAARISAMFLLPSVASRSMASRESNSTDMEDSAVRVAIRTTGSRIGRRESPNEGNWLS